MTFQTSIRTLTGVEWAVVRRHSHTGPLANTIPANTRTITWLFRFVQGMRTTAEPHPNRGHSGKVRHVQRPSSSGALGVTRTGGADNYGIGKMEPTAASNK